MAKKKASEIDLTPPQAARKEAERALAWRREFGRGATAVGIARARDIKNGVRLSPSTVRRMKAFFDRHEIDSKAEGFRPGEKGYPSNGRIAWAAWGGDAGRRWAEKIVRRLNAARSTDKRSATIDRKRATMTNIERRYFGSFGAAEQSEDGMLSVEERAEEGGVKKTYVVGYAAKFGMDSVLLGDFVERIAPTAFDILKEGKDLSGKPIQTRGLFNHDPNHLLGRYPSTMKLSVDEKGLRYEILLPETRKDIAEMVRRGDLRGSSFSFIVAESGGEKWHYEKGQSIRTVLKIKTLVDCGPVTYPAYDSSSCAIAQRSYQQFAAKRSERMEKRNSLMSVVTAEIAKTQEFIAERRGGDCGRDADGKFSSGNACASGSGSGSSKPNAVIKKTTGGDSIKSSAKKIISDTASGATLGAAIHAGYSAAAGAAVGASIGGVPGAIGGAVVGAATGAGAGAVIGGASAGGVSASTEVGSKVASAISPSTKQNNLINLGGALAGFVAGGIPGAMAGAAITSIGQGVANKISSAGKARFESAKKGVRVSDSQLKAAQKILDGNSRGKASGKVNAWTNNDGKVHMHDDSGKNLASVSKVGNATNAHVHVDWAVAGTDAPKLVSKVGKALGTNRVSTEVPDNDAGDVMGKALAKAGFREDKNSTGDASGSRVYVKTLSKPKVAKRFDELVVYFTERRDCGRDDDGKFSSGNDCGSTPSSSGKYMEWKKGKDHKDKEKEKSAQEFLDRAREEQLSKGGKDGGKSDDGGGVQTWSKGEHFPWTAKQVGSDEGYVQGQHPDGSKTAKYPFKGGNYADAYKKVSEEIKGKPKKRSVDPRQVIEDTLRFLKDRR
jgi:HK97 family phage prohead protease